MIHKTWYHNDTVNVASQCYSKRGIIMIQ